MHLLPHTSHLLRRALLLVGLALLPGLALAQNPDDEGGPAPASPTAVPIDGGASLLLAAGVGLGMARLKKRRA
ncbi:hypothetical protein LRS06_16975 [Hymenobacter sp. J193]|uniref:PID-CTERM protein-sorting domain-containing protein n=1 Tax=Hymenobacter sp. J193 TaxID=2898429 RepID=UPI002151C9DB|nr:hypothetical protein [Hymenobacter sp. J193]MCR5889432.1 hypothetical protein [Hymenobacter sp. J193]